MYIIQNKCICVQNIGKYDVIQYLTHIWKVQTFGVGGKKESLTSSFSLKRKQKLTSTQKYQVLKSKKLNTIFSNEFDQKMPIFSKKCAKYQKMRNIFFHRCWNVSTSVYIPHGRQTHQKREKKNRNYSLFQYDPKKCLGGGAEKIDLCSTLK